MAMDANDDSVRTPAAPDYELAFDEVYPRVRSMVHAFCWRMNISRNEAPDLIQDCMLSAWASIDRFDHEAELSSWLYTIAHRRCVDWCRKAIKDRMALVEDDGSAIEAAAASPVSDDWRRRLADRVLVALEARGDGRLRQTFRWWLNGESPSDLARLEGTTPNAISQRFRHLKHVLEELHLECDFPEDDEICIGKLHHE